MSTVVSEVAPETVAARGHTGPGSCLRNARIAKELDLTTIAERLHLTVTVVQALEQDDYSDLTARVFVRGYLRNYARLVGVSIETVLTQFDEVWPASERPMHATPSPRLAADSHPKNHWWRIVTWGLLLLGMLLFLLWWQGYLSHFGQQPTPAVSDTSSPVLEQQVIPPNKELPTQAPATSLSPPLPQSNIDASIVPTAVVSDSAPNVLLAPTEPIASNDAAVVPEAVLTPEVLQESVDAASVTVQQPPVVTVHFRETCWVDIRDHTRDFKLVGKMTAGSRQQLQGEAPYQVVIGNAAAATLDINGEPYDMQPHIRGNVARFILQP